MGADTTFKAWLQSLSLEQTLSMDSLLYELTDPSGTPTSKQITLGNIPTNFSVGLSRGANLAPAFGSSYTETQWTEGAGSMAINYTGANSFAPTTALGIVSGETYEVILTMAAYTSGTFTITLGGATSPAITPAASQIYVFYLTASSTANLSVSAAASGAQVYTIASISVKRVANKNYIIDTNTGNAVQRNIYLSTAAAGMQFVEYVLAAYATKIYPAASGSFYMGTTQYSTSLTLGTVRQTFVSLASYVADIWDLSGYQGSVVGA